MTTREGLHILCFGASLTAGYLKSGALYHPYAGALEVALNKAFPSVNITIDVQGLSGDDVISPPGGFLPRMDILYEEAHPAHPYTHAVILGGTNDLVHLRHSREIYQALQAVWAIPLSHNTTVIALTIPECPGCSQVPAARLDRLNAAIMKRGGCVEDGGKFYTLDLHARIPYVDLHEEERSEIWGDGVHFTAKGYDLMGNIIAEKIINLVASEMEELGEVDEVETKHKNVETNKIYRLKDDGKSERNFEGKLLRSGRVL
ncbi:SGNH hydrolase [Venustampulla echinocandica]|uniref:SGNH hydrolase n=1 Tax=Venustampulla echinocandica TaxID=2656787 RepID=A0A370TSQ6_9HELO|nr:SGNH hydrolase [Venustampulla echinocandica]RDL38528.1 SGNH hydrolase [Venustampulla echinocandica]